MRRLFTLTVDTEEEWAPWTTWPTSGYALTNIQRLPDLQDLCDRVGARTTYFTNHAVVADADAARVIVELAARPGVEIGMHVHPWNTPPLADAPARARDTYLENAPPTIVQAKLTSVWQAFGDLGLRPTSFRGGRYSSGPKIQAFLRGHGFTVDSSVVPFTAWDDDGSPDYCDRTPWPTRLPGEPPLWEIPLTRAFTRRPFVRWHRHYEFVRTTFLRRLRIVGLAERLGLVRKVWLNFEQHQPDDMFALLPALRAEGLPCLVLTLHSSSLSAGNSPYCPTYADEQRIWSNLETVLARLPTEGFEPATLADVARFLEEDHHARAGNQSA